VPSADALDAVLGVEDVLHLQEEAERVRAEEPILDYMLAVVAATRSSPLLSLGVSPRGALALLRAARARALADDRDYLVPDDVKALAVPALAHRVLVRGGTGQPRDRGVDAESVIRTIASEIPVPR
jgi:MoxR-like ATPase